MDFHINFNFFLKTMHENVIYLDYWVFLVPPKFILCHPNNHGPSRKGEIQTPWHKLPSLSKLVQITFLVFPVHDSSLTSQNSTEAEQLFVLYYFIEIKLICHKIYPLKI